MSIRVALCGIAIGGFAMTCGAQGEGRAPLQEGWAGVVEEPAPLLEAEAEAIPSPDTADVKAEISEVEKGIAGDASTGHGRLVIRR